MHLPFILVPTESVKREGMTGCHQATSLQPHATRKMTRTAHTKGNEVIKPLKLIHIDMELGVRITKGNAMMT